MIEVRNLTKKYGSHTAVDNISFSVEEGKIYGFLGTNGAGKSTTMNIITGYLTATEGDVVINGHDILKEPLAARAAIGYLPEQPPLYQDMTVREYLGFAAELKGVAKGERSAEVERVMEKLALTENQNRLIRNLSKGYKQRVGFAQALLGKPAVLILDEPTVGLDPKQIIEIRSLIRELGEDHTVILSSHILSEVSEVCDHIMIMSGGHLVASSSASDLMQTMQPVTRLQITALTDPVSAEEIMSGMEGIGEYSVRASSTEIDAVDIDVSYDSETDRRGQISEAFSRAGFTIIRMDRAAASLEEVFLELTEMDRQYTEAGEEAGEAAEGAETEGQEAGVSETGDTPEGDEAPVGSSDAGDPEAADAPDETAEPHMEEAADPAVDEEGEVKEHAGDL